MCMLNANSVLTGSGWERGAAYGRQWKWDFQPEPHMRPSGFWQAESAQKNEVKERYFTNLKKAFPDLADELAGIAEGAGVPLGKVLDWALIDGFCWGLEPEGGARPADPMCTNLSLTGGCDDPMLAQTVDAPDAALLVTHRVYPKDGFNHIHLGRLGSLVATTGFNEKGLAIGSVSSYATSQNLDGFVCGMLIRSCLQYCAGIGEAIELFTKHVMMFGGYTVNLTEQSGKTAILEKTSDGQEVRYMEGPYAFNTKFVTPTMRAKYTPAIEAAEQRGYDRLDTFERLMKAESAPYTADTAVRAMSDHSVPGPIWDWSTRLGSVIFLRSKKMRVYLGPPDITSYEEICL